MDLIKHIFAKQRASSTALKLSSAKDRITRLKRLKTAVLAQAPALREAIHADYRKSPAEVDLTEVYPIVVEINHAIKNLKAWMEPKPVPTPRGLFGTSSELRYEPKGVTLIIGPWNYPFSLVIKPLVSAIAAGNTAIIKPSELTEQTSRFIKQFLGTLFDESEVAVLEGDATLTQKLLEQPFDHIFFTGSPRVGKIVMTAAARRLCSVTLEQLGGKSPVILDESADLVKAADRITVGKFVNAGQTCVAPDYVLVPESKLAAYLQAQAAAIARHYGASDDSRRSNPDYCRLINARNFERVRSLLEQSVQEGAKIEVGGACDAAERYVAPTVLSRVTYDMPIMREEIFGPLLPVIAYRELSDVYQRLREQGEEKPLALYIFSENARRTEEILRNTTAGGTCVNQAILHVANPHLPFGGTGHSGMGASNGFYGFRAFSHERAVLRQGKIDSFKLVNPPYTAKVRKMIERVTRYLS